MKKVLISGMTASQSSQVYSSRSKTFVGCIADALLSAGVVVDWEKPNTDKESRKDYDHVIVGVAPILSLAANRAFTALDLIESLWDSDKLTLLVDAPEPVKLHASLRSASKNPQSLVKDLYARRYGYSSLVRDNKHFARITKIIDVLIYDNWKKTLFPVLPWSDPQKLISGIPTIQDKLQVGLCVDSFIIEPTHKYETTYRFNQWVVENENTKWFRKISSTLQYPTIPAKVKRTHVDADVINNLLSSAGTLISQHDDKVLWWSSRFAQAISTNTPVATEWRESQSIGDAWSHLAAGIEEMTYEDRYELASAQKAQYVAAMPTKEETTERLLKELNLQ